MDRTYRTAIASLWALVALLWLSVVVQACRAALPVRVQVYSCQAAVPGSGNTITLEQCRIVDDSNQDQDQAGDDAVDVKADPGETGEAPIKAFGPIVVGQIAEDFPRARRKRKATSPRRVRVKGYTRRAPARRGRK